MRRFFARRHRSVFVGPAVICSILQLGTRVMADPGERTAWVHGAAPGRGVALELGPAGDLYVAGSGDGYEIIHYDTTGNVLLTRQYEGPDSLYETVRALEVDHSGNVYLTGVVD